MAEPVLATSELKKKYGEVVAVDGVSWSVPQGSVFGLLGPNGAGKTTMIGMLLGLIKPDSGTISLFGDSGPPERSLPKIGAIMETPAFYPYLSGRDNLRYFQGISTHEDPAEIDRLLELVSLSRRADSKFSTYSLGMKHRLGIAYSLLGDPPLLLLDEPTNGLDPSGMAEVRSVIKELGSGDRTIVLASHLLNEVEQVCDSVAILSNGSLVAQGPVSELIDRSDRLRVEGWNSAGWLFGKGGEPIPGFNLVGAIGQAGYPGELHSFLVQLAYTALFLGVAFRQFQKRDVTGPSG